MGLVDLLLNLALGGQVWVTAPPEWAQGIVACVRTAVEVLAAV